MIKIPPTLINNLSWRKKVFLFSSLLIPLLVIPFTVYLIVSQRQEIRKEAASSSLSSSSASLGDYWQGKAEWKFLRKLTLANTGWSYGYGAGAHIEVVNGVWYLFSRKVNWGNKPAYCSFMNETLGTEVRKSLDKGGTWSQPVNIIIPQEGKPWECAATDGDAYYDAIQNKWHYLFQCLNRDNVWRGCHLEKQDSDPMGLFTQTHSNPVINSRSLWRKVCDQWSDDCVTIPGGVNKVFDEGTWDVFHYDGAYFYVGFHGFDGTRGYRGIAKTRDFVNWIAGDPSQGVPEDAVFDKNDAAQWRENWQGGSIGGGAGSVLYENGYFYQLVEAADINLLCTNGQNWDWGILRSVSLTNTSWEQFPLGNPIIYSSKYPERNGKPIGCNPAYTHLFKDPETNVIYLHYTRESMDNNYSGIYFYQLVPSNNLLQNGDLWKCNSENWQKFPIGPTNIVVYRYPNQSSDGGCYLATNCGASTCQPGQSVYQDIDVLNIPSRNIAYGGKFATDSGTGVLNLVIFELDANSAIIASHQTTLNPTPEYQSIRKDLTLSSQTKTVRFQLYLDSPHTFKADEMFFETTTTPSPSPSPTPSPSPSPTPTPTPTPTPSGVSVIKFTSQNVAGGNAYTYWKTLADSTTLATNDAFEYDVYLGSNVTAIGGIDIRFTTGTYARDVPGWVDQNGVSCHPGFNISSSAYGKWFKRKCTVPSDLNGKVISWIDLVNENDTATAIIAYYNNFVIKNNSGVVKTTIHTGGAPDYNQVDFKNNASNTGSAIQSPEPTPIPTPTPTPTPSGVSVIKFTSQNVAGGNAYTYWKTLDDGTTLSTGDTLEYDVYLGTNVAAIGGIDLRFTNSQYARDITGWVDQNGIACHPNRDLTLYAYGKWFHRTCKVPSGLNGKVIDWLDLVNENDTNTQITAYYDNFVIKNSAGTAKKTIYTQGNPHYNSLDFRNNAGNTGNAVQFQGNLP